MTCTVIWLNEVVLVMTNGDEDVAATPSIPHTHSVWLHWYMGVGMGGEWCCIRDAQCQDAQCGNFKTHRIITDSCIVSSLSEVRGTTLKKERKMLIHYEI